MIIVNFKSYSQVSADKALENAKICEKVFLKTGVKIIVGIQATDIYRVASQVKIPVFGQHCDPLLPHRNTGWLTPFALKQAGAKGVFLNHSEHPFSNFNSLKKAILMAKKEKLQTLVFVPNLKMALKTDKLNPDYLALEEPSLVSKKAMINFPKFVNLIKNFAKKVKSFPILGAGIRSRKDVQKSLSLGVKGIAFSSEFIKAKNKEKLLLSFVSCFK